MKRDQFKDRLKAAGFVGGRERAVHFSEIAKALDLPEEELFAELLLPFWAFGETHFSLDKKTGLVTLRAMGSDFSSSPLKAPVGPGASRVAGSGDARGGGPFAGERAAEDLEARSEQEWNSSADLRGEFTSLAAYQAYRRAEASGRVGVFSRQTVKRYRREHFPGARPGDTC
jgi:hypothetical protein